MRALTLFQPWASLLVYGRKTYETRGYRISHRGLVAIHAGKERRFLDDWLEDQDDELEHEYPLGAIVGVAVLVGVIPTDGWEAELLSDKDRAFGDWSEGRYAWKMENVRLLKSPVPCRGAQGLWNVPGDTQRVMKLVGLKD